MGGVDTKTQELGAGAQGAQTLEKGMPPAAAGISEESEEAGFGSAERKWGLEPTAAAVGVVLAVKEETGTQSLLSPCLPIFLEYLLLPEPNRKPAGPGSRVCRVLALAMEQNAEEWIQAERHQVNNSHSISLCIYYIQILSIFLCSYFKQCSINILVYTFSLELVSGSKIKESKKMHIFKAFDSG